MKVMHEKGTALRIKLVQEYARLRVSEYLELMLPEKKLRDYEEIRFYDNIMECMSMIDYANIKLPEYTENLLARANKLHEKELKRLMKEGKYKIL